ncbi:NADH dehydrogenase [ubiquinone] 1 alpha subcomplex subunit 3, partial [Ophiophagus hannah]
MATVTLPLVSPFTRYTRLMNERMPYHYPVPVRDDGSMPDIPAHPCDKEDFNWPFNHAGSHDTINQYTVKNLEEILKELSLPSVQGFPTKNIHRKHHGTLMASLAATWVYILSLDEWPASVKIRTGTRAGKLRVMELLLETLLINSEKHIRSNHVPVLTPCIVGQALDTCVESSPVAATYPPLPRLLVSLHQQIPPQFLTHFLGYFHQKEEAMPALSQEALKILQNSQQP